MPEPFEKKEPDNVKAIVVGLFLIILIAAVTVFKSDSSERSNFEKNKIADQEETVELMKVKKITQEELASMLLTGSDLDLIDLRDGTSYRSEHIIDSTNVPVSESSQLLFFQFAGLYAINGQFPRVGRIQCPDNLQ